ncbi:hypothetical protein [Chryseobacterium contaminans]|uniref:hypothetical protein n=1 Tax=Chryseobacterium contaminans TaxID=1423959 RepID=UPI0030189598
MKNKLFTLALLSVGFSLSAQVGINTGQPQATFDVVGFPSDSAKLDGVIAPRLTGVQLKAKSYTTAQTGAIVYVTVAETAPTGQTVDVITPGYYYFDGTKWGNLNADWRTVGNSGTVATSATLGKDISTGNYLGTTDGQNLVLATQKNVKGILDVNGTLQGGNANDASGPYAAFSWGSNNITNSTSSNVAIGRNNTATAINSNFPALAIGANNSATSGAKIIGNSNTASGANHFVFGNSNTVSGATGLTLGNLHNNKGGIAIGSGNTVDPNSIAVGSASSAVGGKAFVVGFSGTANSGQTVYANGTQVFFDENNVATTNVGINMVPSSVNFADLEVSKAIQIKANARPTCDASNAGTIIYEVSLSVGNFVGCKQTGAGTFTWQIL